MKSPFKKLRDLAVSKHIKDNEPSSLAEDLLEPEDVTRDMENVESIRLLYEVLVTNAHTISGAAYDFSRSVQDMASHMMEAFGQYVDGEIGNIYSMLAKVQFEISKLLDIFAAHVSQTIITPTEKMIGEIQQFQVMKEQYDEKRNTFNLLRKDMQKGKPKSGNLDITDQLALAKEECNNQANVLGARLHSFTQGQSLTLITQAARYHSAQMHLFSKGLASITAMEPVMKQLALDKNIDRSMSETAIGNDISLEDIREEDDASKFGADSESLTSSPTTEAQDSAVGTSDVDMNPRKLDASSKSAPLSSSMYQKERRKALETSFDAVGLTRISMYALPSPSVAGQGQATSDPNSMHQPRKFLSLKTPVTDHTTSQPLNAPRVHDNAAEENAKHDRSDEKMITFVELPNDVKTNKIPKMSRSYSHSGGTSSKNVPSGKHPIVSIPSSSSYRREQSDLFHRSAPVSRGAVFTSPRSQNIAALVSPPQISELHKLPPPPSPKSAGPIPHLVPSGKKVQEATPPKSGPTSPLPPTATAPDFDGGTLSIPAIRMHEPGLQHESTMSSQVEIVSPPRKSFTRPVTTGML